jgi:hypothetical protein
MDWLFETLSTFNSAMMFLAGSFFTFAGGLFMLSFAHEYRTHRKVRGTIVDVSVQGGRGGATVPARRRRHGLYSPIIEYSSPEGARVRAFARSWSTRLANRLSGRSLDILVDPAVPQLFRLVGAW